ncbi:MAG: hypothetical protein C0623_06900 [Desulfuromonas sp.]|nr:MAG: hypothetical protein C0623_06900 [Desulfuromonas sp.]
MRISKLAIKNIASFSDFSSDVELKKTTLLFGTNGSGKSTIASLLQLIERTNSAIDQEEAIKELKAYISDKASKEDITGESKVSIRFNENWESVKYLKATNTLSLVRSRNPRPLDGVRDLWLCQKGSWQSIFRCCSRNDLNRKESHEPFSEVNTCHMALPVSYSLGAKVSFSHIGRGIGPGSSSVYSDIQ